MTPEEIKAAVAARIAAEQAEGISTTITDPVILAELARIVGDAVPREVPPVPQHRRSA